ncbi:MAG: hypothetical protein IRF12RH_07285 [Rickettsia helvetica]|uniref:DNA primase n=1 Tax=Rickettsia helvetica TaxID=35789 RepID=A0ABP0T635_RICHE
MAVNRWYDFSKGEGGDLFTLVQREKNCDFIEAKKYLQDMVGISNNSKLLEDKIKEQFDQKVKNQDQQAKYAEISKIKRAYMKNQTL